MKPIAELAFIALTLGAIASGASAAPVVYFGTGATTANADAAFADWLANVSGQVTDQLDGLAGTWGVNANLTSALGNNFKTTDDIGFNYLNAFNVGVIQGAHLLVDMSGPPIGTFVWNLVTPSNAFGFFSLDNDGSEVTVTFEDGALVTLTLKTASEEAESSFFGVTGLGSLVSSVTISTADPGGISRWDRFSLGSTVPEPGTLALAALGLTALGLTRRRRQQPN